MDITRVVVYDGWYAKREDEAAYVGPDYLSGAKVRQYVAMIERNPTATLIVGCVPHGAQQIYVAAAAKLTGRPGVIYTAARRRRTEATEYALRLGAEVVEVRPGYLSTCRARARARAKEIGNVVRWDFDVALDDTIAQCVNLPTDAGRIVVPTGSGLTCAGVLAGLAQRGLQIPVVAVAVSDMASIDGIVRRARTRWLGDLPYLTLIRAPGRYGDSTVGRLPDGTPLDPYYAAKALPHVMPGDCLWVQGVRPLSAMPESCRAALGVAQ